LDGQEIVIPVLGLDVGTGGSRAIVVDDDGTLRASATIDHAPFVSLGPAWAEQAPEDWWRASREAVRRAIAESGLAARSIAGVGLSGQMHGAVLLDEQRRVIRPAIIWCDQRTATECQWLTKTIGASRLLELTCNPALPNFTLTKLLWVRDHEPDAWSRLRHVLLPKDYVRYCLSGELATDVADASGTLMLDVAARRWSSGMLDAVGLRPGVLPALFESPEVCARVSPEAAAATGLAAGTPIVEGAGEQAAGAVGMGITRPGAVSATIGTSGVVFAATDRPALDPKGRLHTFCHAMPRRWHVMGVTQAAGLSLRWLRELFLFPGAERGSGTPASAGVGGSAGAQPHGPSYDELTKEAAGVPAGADGVLWAPYLMGERTPHLDPDARAALVGLTASHTRGHVVRAVLEGVAFSLRDSFSIFSELGVPVDRVRVGGGGARSGLWREIQAATYGRAVETVEAEEGAAYGAALLAGVGAGIWSSVDEACEAVVRVKEVTRPADADVAAMNAAYRIYRRVYPALRTIQSGLP
jgi:xylulokinase